MVFSDPIISTILKNHKENIINICNEKEFLKFKAWKGDLISNHLKKIIKMNDIENFYKFWPYINYYILYKKFKKFKI